MTAVIGRGAFGDLVSLLQSGLASRGYYTSKVDGDFGGGTERALCNFQSDSKLKPTGAADEKTWVAVTGTAWPELFERCLAVTARFEGHGYQAIAGNFDGAGLTWGIIGFTLQHGEIQSIVNEIQLRDPLLVRDAFGDLTDELLKRMRAPINASLIAWANSISVGANKYSVVQAWRDGFVRLGSATAVREMQRKRARIKYFEPALVTSARVQQGDELESDLGVGLCFDIHVQNGGIEASDLALYRRKLAALPSNATNSDKRIALAEVVAAHSRAKYRGDVLSRKRTYASGVGVVHGQNFNLMNWGLAAD